MSLASLFVEEHKWDLRVFDDAITHRPLLRDAAGLVSAVFTLKRVKILDEESSSADASAEGMTKVLSYQINEDVEERLDLVRDLPSTIRVLYGCNPHKGPRPNWVYDDVVVPLMCCCFRIVWVGQFCLTECINLKSK